MGSLLGGGFVLALELSCRVSIRSPGVSDYIDHPADQALGAVYGRDVCSCANECVINLIVHPNVCLHVLSASELHEKSYRCGLPCMRVAQLTLHLRCSNFVCLFFLLRVHT